MLKMFVSPIFLTLVVLFFCEIFFIKYKKKAVYFAKTVIGFTFFALWFVSTNIGANFLAKPLESQCKGIHGDLKHLRVIVVLSSGYHVDILGRKTLDDFSFARVYYGVKAFHKSKARYLIMTGRLKDGDKRVMTQLMKNEAIDLGVPHDHIVLEPNARNTAEHPIEVRKLNLVGKNDWVGIATSAWHLPRAMTEFRRYYPNLIPIPADSLVNDQPQGIDKILPSPDALQRSTLAINEYVGQVWYVIRHVNSK